MTGQTISHLRSWRRLARAEWGSCIEAAFNLMLDRQVALKVLPADKIANADRRRRFIQEAKAASALNHPNIVTIMKS
jgi:serine/threonine protein kinase